MTLDILDIEAIAAGLIGLVVGVIAGIVGSILIYFIFDPKSDVKAILPIGAMLLPIFGAIYGVEWIKTVMAHRPLWLIPSGCAAFLLTILYPAVRMILHVGQSMGRGSPP